MKFGNSTSRKEFEQWAIEQQLIVTLDSQVVIDGYPIYARPFTHVCWMAWQASRGDIGIGLPDTEFLADYTKQEEISCPEQ